MEEAPTKEKKQVSFKIVEKPPKPSIKKILLSSLKVFLKTLMLKLLISLLSGRLKANKKFAKEAFNFGLSGGLNTLILKLTKHFLRRKSEFTQNFTGGLLCGLPFLYLTEEGEQTLIKLVLYPRVGQIMIDHLTKEGYLPEWKHKYLAFFWVACF